MTTFKEEVERRAKEIKGLRTLEAFIDWTESIDSHQIEVRGFEACDEQEYFIYFYVIAYIYDGKLEIIDGTCY